MRYIIDNPSLLVLYREIEHLEYSHKVRKVKHNNEAVDLLT